MAAAARTDGYVSFPPFDQFSLPDRDSPSSSVLSRVGGMSVVEPSTQTYEFSLSTEAFRKIENDEIREFYAKKLKEQETLSKIQQVANRLFETIRDKNLNLVVGVIRTELPKTCIRVIGVCDHTIKKIYLSLFITNKVLCTTGYKTLEHVVQVACTEEAFQKDQEYVVTSMRKITDYTFLLCSRNFEIPYRLKKIDPHFSSILSYHLFVKVEDSFLNFLHENGSDSEDYFPVELFSKYCHGGDLHEALKKKVYSKEEKYHILLEVAKNLVLMHENGLVHRDVKDKNVFFEEERAFLADFDFSHQLPRSEVDPKEIRFRGTAGFIAPELLSDPSKVVSEYPFDVWSFGILFAKLFYGEHPILTFLALVEEFFGKAGRLSISERLSAAERILSHESFPLSVDEKETFRVYVYNFGARQKNAQEYCYQLVCKATENFMQLIEKAEEGEFLAKMLSIDALLRPTMSEVVERIISFSKKPLIDLAKKIEEDDFPLSLSVPGLEFLQQEFPDICC